MHGVPTEAVLVSAAAQGSSQAFEMLATSHRAMIWSVCLRVTRNTHDAEDAVQDTLLAAWRGVGKFRGESDFGTWLYRIASNAALSVVNKRRTAEAGIPEELEVQRDFAEQVASCDVLRRALRSMPEDFRLALVLREFCDFTYAQIAEYQGVEVATVKSRINRGRKALKAALADPHLQ
jgi:RNA polymerase sigma factor (sigma-70 family)